MNLQSLPNFCPESGTTTSRSRRRRIGSCFCGRLKQGAADRSYGIEVAKLAGIPGPVTQRAREILKKHEENEHQLSDNLTVRARRKPKIVINQMSLFTALEEELRNALRAKST